MKLLATILLILSLQVLAVSHSPDVYWIEKYGRISWDYERAHLDNFAIQIQNEPDNIGYVYIYAGQQSCSGEAFAHALKIRRYLMDVRGIPWDRIVICDLGYDDAFHVTAYLFPKGKPPLYSPEYVPPTPEHIIKRCDSKRKEIRRA